MISLLNICYHNLNEYHIYQYLKCVTWQISRLEWWLCLLDDLYQNFSVFCFKRNQVEKPISKGQMHGNGVKDFKAILACSGHSYLTIIRHTSDAAFSKYRLHQ